MKQPEQTEQTWKKAYEILYVQCAAILLLLPSSIQLLAISLMNGNEGDAEAAMIGIKGRLDKLREQMAAAVEIAEALRKQEDNEEC